MDFMTNNCVFVSRTYARFGYYGFRGPWACSAIVGIQMTMDASVLGSRYSAFAPRVICLFLLNTKGFLNATNRRSAR